MKIKTLIAILMSVMILSACAPARSVLNSTIQKSGGVESAPMALPAQPAPALEAPVAVGAPSYDASGNTTVAVPSGAQDRLVIKNGNISIVVADPAASMDVIAKMADGMGGWVVTSNLFKTQTKDGVEIPQANISIRVPADKLNDALTQIKAQVKNLETDVLSENVSGQDVTAEYTDLTSRKNNLERAEAQLQEIMASATKTEDVLNVFNQLTQIRSEIEVLKGQIKYYEESSSFSAISIELISEKSIEPVTVGGWKPQGVARDAVQALINTFKVIVNILIWFIILIIPILIVLYFVVRAFIWLFKLIFLRKKTKKQVEQSTVDSTK